MRLITQSNSPLIWPRKFNCGDCGSLLAVDIEDIKRNVDYTGDFTSYWVSCPACHGQPDVPEAWWDTVRRLQNPLTQRD
jgi:hypothetical protein